MRNSYSIHCCKTSFSDRLAVFMLPHFIFLGSPTFFKVFFACSTFSGNKTMSLYLSRDLSIRITGSLALFPDFLLIIFQIYNYLRLNRNAS